jgi:hypothetical protein
MMKLQYDTYDGGFNAARFLQIGPAIQQLAVVARSIPHAVNLLILLLPAPCRRCLVSWCCATRLTLPSWLKCGCLLSQWGCQSRH